MIERNDYFNSQFKDQVELTEMASAIAKCGVRVVILFFIFSFIFLCHMVVNQNNHEYENEVTFQSGDKITGAEILKTTETKTAEIVSPGSMPELSHTNIVPSSIPHVTEEVEVDQATAPSTPTVEANEIFPNSTAHPDSGETKLRGTSRH